MKKYLAVLATLLLAACHDAPTGYKAPPLDFAGKPPIRVNVAEVRVVDNYQSPLRAPNVEQDFPIPPNEAVKQWVKQRIYAVGTSGVLEVNINDASVKEVKLPKTEGIKGLFTNDQEARYDASLVVSLKLYTGLDAISAASGDVSVTRSHSINEDATINDRQRIYDGMTRDMIALFDTQATQRLQQYFRPYLK